MSVSPNERYLWPGARLSPIPEPKKLQAAQLLRLLEENDTIAPDQFSYRKEDRRLLLSAAMENRDIRPARFRTELDRLLKTIKRTHSLWDTSKWPVI